MKDTTGNRPTLHPAAVMYASEVRAGQTVSRREFLTRTTALGVSAAAAYGLIWAWTPRQWRRTRPQWAARCAWRWKPRR